LKSDQFGVLLERIEKPVLLLLLLLAGCSAGTQYAPVEDRKNGSAPVSNRYVVSAGETLYSIAWRFGKDIKELARANKIPSPYTIYSGQQLVLSWPANSTQQQPSSSLQQTTSPQTTSATKSTVRPVQKSSSKIVVNNKTVPKKGYPFRWQWPAKGALMRVFSLNGAVHKGIDLKGNMGEPVHAANSGKVVYAGSGLVGYGNLLIIKHNDRYLSAYGHNSILRVTEGEQVKVGQHIADIGNTGAKEVKLHFEIRRDGKPVDPLKLLPGRSN
jgi:lipoprotein NlpD